jgi:hypothetical protein
VTPEIFRATRSRIFLARKTAEVMTQIICSHFRAGDGKAVLLLFLKEEVWRRAVSFSFEKRKVYK